MDLIFLPESPHCDVCPSMLTEAGQDRLCELVDWCVEADDIGTLDFYVHVPSSESHWKSLQSLFSAFAPGPQINVVLIADIATLSVTMLKEIDASGLRNVVFLAGSDAKQNESGMTVFADYLAEVPQSRLQVGCWLADSGDGRDSERAEAFVRFGLSSATIDSPLFEPVRAIQSVNIVDDLPPELRNRHSHCQLFGNTITVDGNGDVRFCPRDAGDDASNLGNLHTDSPEQILIRKGRHALEIGKLGICVDCRIRGRFAWPDRSNQRVASLLQNGLNWKGLGPRPPFRITDIRQLDVSSLNEQGQEKELADFGSRLREWSGSMKSIAESNQTIVSVEIPAFKGSWLMPCIESVLFQTSTDWTLSLLWDGGDELSRRILEQVESLNDPRVSVYFRENQGIARARRFLSENSGGDYILPVDDDDMLAPDTVERFLAVAAERPWSGIIRARREFINEVGEPVEMDPWFPFEPRRFQYGMVTDPFNHSQPYLISRVAYQKSEGWEGFEDFHFAGEDCDIFLKIEEVAPIELLDEVLYYYRLNSQRTSHSLKPEGAYEMWRRLADKTIKRIGLPVRRTNELQPFEYERLPQAPATSDMIDFVIAFFESDELELDYEFSRPPASFTPVMQKLDGRNSFVQQLDGVQGPIHRIEVVCTSEGPVHGLLRAELQTSDGRIIATGNHQFEGDEFYFHAVSIELEAPDGTDESQLCLRLAFLPERKNYHDLLVLRLPGRTSKDSAELMVRLFQNQPGHSRRQLDRCIASLKRCGINNDAIHVVAKQQSCSRNRNDGFRQTTRPLVCYVDDDVEFTSEATFDRLLDVMNQKQMDMVGPKIVTDDGKIFCAHPYFNEKQRPVPRGLGESDEGQYDYYAEVSWLPSTVLLTRREVIQSVGGFDEGYPGSQMEDVDYCFRVRARAFRCAYVGDVEVIHYNRQRNHNLADNFQVFFRKWSSYPQLFESPVGDATPSEVSAGGNR